MSMKNRFYLLTGVIGLMFLLACGDKQTPDSDSKKSPSASVFDEFKKCYGQGEKTINLTTLDWQPYIGADMKDFGPVHELVVEAFKRKGYRICTAFFTWERTNKMGSQGVEADGYFPEYYSKDYEDKLAFSKGYPAGPAGFFKRKDKNLKFKTKPGMQNFKKLKPYKIGVVRGYVNTAPLDEAIGQFAVDIKDPVERKKAMESAYLLKNRDPADSDLQNLEKLYHDRVQLVFIDPNVAAYHMEKTLTAKYRDIDTKLEFMTPPLIIHKIYTCISKNAKNYKEKLKDFNEGIAEINKDGTLRKIMEKHGFRTSDGVNFVYKG